MTASRALALAAARIGPAHPGPAAATARYIPDMGRSEILVMNLDTDELARRGGRALICQAALRRRIAR